MTATGWGVQNEDSDTAATNLREVCILIKIHLTVVSLHNKLTVYYVRHNRFGCNGFRKGIAEGGYLERW